MTQNKLKAILILLVCSILTGCGNESIQYSRGWDAGYKKQKEQSVKWQEDWDKGFEEGVADARKWGYK